MLKSGEESLAALRQWVGEPAGQRWLMHRLHKPAGKLRQPGRRLFAG
ncbi:MAG: hypothetical protein AB1591_11280 [Pseudomonadota bacterium]